MSDLSMIMMIIIVIIVIHYTVLIVASIMVVTVVITMLVIVIHLLLYLYQLIAIQSIHHYICLCRYSSLGDHLRGAEWILALLPRGATQAVPADR